MLRDPMSITILVSLFALWSSVFPLGKMALEVSPPLFLTAARMLLAGFLLLGFLAWRKPYAFKINTRQFISIAILSIFSMYLANAFEFWGLKQMSAAKTCFFYSLSPFFAALFSYLHFKEKMSGQKMVGMAIGFVGFIPVLMAQKGSDELLSSLGFLSWPELSIIAASICAVYGWVFMRKFLKTEPLPVLLVNALAMVFGGLFALIHSLFVDSWNPIPVASTHVSSFVVGFLVIVIISNLICYNLYGFLLKRFTATFMSFMGLLYPLFASINSWLFLGEPISMTIIGSSGIVSIGLWLFYRAELNQGYILKPA